MKTVIRILSGLATRINQLFDLLLCAPTHRCPDCGWDLPIADCDREGRCFPCQLDIAASYYHHSDDGPCDYCGADMTHETCPACGNEQIMTYPVTTCRACAIPCTSDTLTQTETGFYCSVCIWQGVSDDADSESDWANRDHGDEADPAGSYGF